MGRRWKGALTVAPRLRHMHSRDALAGNGGYLLVNHFAVIGEHDDDPDRLLVVGEDGQPYAWELATDATVPVEVDEQWTIDDDLPETGLTLEDRRPT